MGMAPKWDETGEILYVRGLITAMLGIEAIRTAQEKFGKKPMTGEQVRWGFENLDSKWLRHRVARSNRFRTVRADLRSKGESARRRRSRQDAPPMMSREWEQSRASGLAAKRLPLAPALRLGGARRGQAHHNPPHRRQQPGDAKAGRQVRLSHTQQAHPQTSGRRNCNGFAPRRSARCAAPGTVH